MAVPSPHRLFFAIRPPRDAAWSLQRLADGWRRTRGVTAPLMPHDRLHISLNSLGAHDALPSRQIAAAKAAVAAVSMPPFVVALDRVGTWGRGEGVRRVVAWADDGLVGVHFLHGHIHRALARSGLGSAVEPSLQPHLTLLRAKDETPLEFVDPVSWRVEEFVLLDSVWGEGRHEEMGRWRLAG
jgi:2'-5' RNA ligase